MSIASILPNPPYEMLDSDLISNIIKMMPAVVHVSDCESRQLLFANNKLTEILGYATSDLQNGLGNIFEEAVLDCENSYKADLEYYTKKHAVKRKDGVEVILQTRSMVHKLDEKGNPKEIIGISHDVTEAEKTETERRRMEDVLNEAERMMNFGSWTWLVPEDKILWSDGLFELMGYDPKDKEKLALTVNKYTELVHPDDAEGLQKKNEYLLATGEQYDDYEHRIITPAGELKTLTAKVRITEYEPDGTTIKRIVGSTIDSTYLKKIQNELEYKIAKLDASNRDLEQFAYVASHDLQEPLRKIVAFGERLEATLQGKLDAQSEMYISRMSDAANRMRELINNLLSLSRLSSSETPTRVNLNEIMENVLRNYELTIEERKATLLVDNLPTVQGIEPQLSQLFNNLVSNALKFTREDDAPKITIKSDTPTSEEIEKLGLRTGNKYFKLTITDNGIGFDNQYGEQIFIIFKRLHGRSTYSGTGIGLAICRKVVQNHGGAIYAQSAPGEGATFVIVLPLI